MTDAGSDPNVEIAANAARSYAVACAEVVRSVNAAAQCANRAVQARERTQQGHEISRENFRKEAQRYESEFVPLCKTFLEACRAARQSAADFRNGPSAIDVELVLLTATNEEAYGHTSVAIHILKTTFGTTPAEFIQGLVTANNAIDRDIFGWGEEGFTGNVYLAPDEVAASSAPAGVGLQRPAPDQTWPDLCSELRRRLPTVDVGESAMRIELSARGRSQVVSVRWEADESGPGWVRVESVFARVSDAALVAAARMLGSSRLLVGMARLDDRLVIRWTGFVRDLAPETVVQMIDSVAVVADRLEAHLTGGGDSL